MTRNEPQWTKAIASEELGDVPAVFKHDHRQIALFRADGRVFAVDNRCPHEGYPLAQGTVDAQCQLTCNWHNWKFRLDDGECVLGGDDVRAYPAKDESGFVWVDLSNSPVEVTQQRILKGLRTAFDKRDFERICREVTRLKLSGIDPMIAVRKAILWSFERLEFGSTHAYAAAADWLAEASRYEGDWERQLVCLAETIDHMAFDALRHPPYSYASGATEFDAQQLAQAIEAEDRIQAESLVARGFEMGLHWKDFEPTFVGAALAHFNDFGHSLIYVYKTWQLNERVPEVQRELSLALTRSLCYTTREDLIPEFSEYAPSLERVRRAVQSASGKAATLSDFPYPASTATALEWVAENLPRANVRDVYDGLLEALARNLFQFDTSYGVAWDRPVSQNAGWLDVTHGVTFANAVRACCARYPEFWPQGLLQMACFVGRNRGFLDEQASPDDWTIKDESAFFARARETILDHGFRDPIFSAHLIKTTLAVEEELAGAGDSCRPYMLAGLNRFLHSPLKQKHVRRLARQAIQLVRRDYRPGDKMPDAEGSLESDDN